jgi:hypothetical protein
MARNESEDKKINSDDQRELLKAGVDELRRLYDAVAHSLDNLRAKALALLVAEIAVVTFLFTSGSDNTFTSIKIIYGIVFLSIGISCLLGSFLMFLWVISPVKYWEHPPESKDLKNIYKNFDHSSIKFLETVKDDYIRIIPNCSQVLTHKSKKFSAGVYLLSAGVFIVLMIKYGGGTLNLVIN